MQQFLQKTKEIFRARIEKFKNIVKIIRNDKASLYTAIIILTFIILIIARIPLLNWMQTRWPILASSFCGSIFATFITICAGLSLIMAVMSVISFILAIYYNGTDGDFSWILLIVFAGLGIWFSDWIFQLGIIID